VSKPSDKLAALGGPRAVPRELKFHVWPKINATDEKFVLASIRQNSHAWGPNCVALQDEFARWNGNRFCAATNSGTAALHMGLAACDVGAGDEVITTTLSWTSTATCIVHHNAIPVFVDIDHDTMLIDPAKIEAAITPRTKAIIPVHYWGLACDMDAIMKIAAKHNIKVIEDACQGHGSLYRGRKAGTFGHCAAFSLNQNKNFSAGEGGLFVSNDEQIYIKARAVMSFGELRAPESNRDFHAYALGWMYRTSDVAAAYARGRLARLDKDNAAAIANWRLLNDGLGGIDGLIRPVETAKQKTNGYAYVFRVAPDKFPKGVDPNLWRDSVAHAIWLEGVPVASARMSLPEHTVIQARQGYGGGCPWSCPMARKDIDYSMSQYPVTVQTVNSSIQVGINGHRPPNGKSQINAIIKGIRKVFSQLDNVPLKDQA
jgi:perosamine synthetase